MGYWLLPTFFVQLIVDVNEKSYYSL